jgi:hypothetical protein
MEVNGKETSDLDIITKHFNEYFINVGPNLSKSIPNSNIDPISYITQTNRYSLFTKPTNETEIGNIIRALKNSAPGPDGIPSSILKENTAHFIQPLTHILNFSLSQDIVPNEMKMDEIKPLFKSGSKHLVNNYRPTLLLPAFSKIFEKCMASRLIEFITKHNLLYQYQFRFREKHSTNMALHLLIDKITNAFDQNKVLVGVALDFRKAFDTLDPSILISKLEKYGIRGCTLDWFRDYLLPS